MTSRATRKSSNVRLGVTKTAHVRRSNRRPKKVAQNDMCACGEDRANSPMLRCGVCNRWYHFQCVDLTDRDAEDLAYYVCPSCTGATGKVSREPVHYCTFLHDLSCKYVFRILVDTLSIGHAIAIDPESALPQPAKLWELDDNEVPEIHVEDSTTAEPPYPHSSDEEGSEDDFVQEPQVLAQEVIGDHSEDETIGTRTHRRGTRKRRSSFKQGDSFVKRHKLEQTGESPEPSSSAPSEDPIRKSCLKILINLLAPIFSESLPEEPDPQSENRDAESFATVLESCVFEIYAEQDDFGEKAPGNKYKDRVRMLNFNLGKRDRQELRKSIRIGRITPDELSRMSSIDLANTQAQQEAQKLAEEAMNHSILQARTAPLRKITHKGEQMIDKTVEEENWRIQQEDQERERERERQRSRVGSLSESAPPATPISASFRRPSFNFPPSATPPTGHSSDGTFDPASTVFNMDFDGESSSMLRNGPATPPELSGDLMDTRDSIFGGNADVNPASLSTSPTTQNFSLDELFGTSETTHPSWSESQGAEGSIAVQSTADDDLAIPDDTDFDAFITVDEDEPEPQTVSERDEEGQAVAVGLPPNPAPSLADLPSLWRGHVGMPSVIDPNRMIQFQSEFKQIGGTPFNDTLENRSALFPVSLFEIIGRVPTSQAVKYLVSMRLNPAKELFAVALVPSETDKLAYVELHKLLIEKDRYGLIFPWSQDPQLSAPGKELYIAPLLPEHPVPEYLQLLDDVKIPEKRDSPIFCGIFVLNKGRVTSLHSIDYAHHPAVPASTPIHSLPLGLGSGDPTSTVPPPSPPVGLPGIPPSVAPVLASSLSNLSESTLATLTKDLANLNPTQRELVRSLLLQQTLPTSTQLAPLAPTPPVAGTHVHVPSQTPPVPVPPTTSNQSPAHHTPASWDRPANYPLEANWIPGPGYFGRDEFREERGSHNRGDSRSDPRISRGRGIGHPSYRGRGNRGGGRW